jgi:hypothetical protein
MKTYPYNSPEYDADAREWMAIYKSQGDSITDRAGIASVLGLSPNRVSELTKAGHLQAASIRPLRYAVEHNRSCYESYTWAVRVGSSLAKLGYS